MRILIDGHQDVAWNKLGIGRDFLESAIQKRLREGLVPSHGEGVALVGWPELQAANVRIIFATIWVQPTHSYYPAPGPKFSSLAQARQQALDQLGYYLEVTQRAPIIIIKTQHDLRQALDDSSYRLGFFLLMEGADPIGEPRALREWVEQGICTIAPVWQTNRYGHGSDDPGPLTSLGRLLLDEMMALGCVLDTAHMAEETFFQAADHFSGIVVNSHSNCRSIVLGERQISDAMIRVIAAHHGVIGVMPWALAMKRDWTASSQKHDFSLNDVVEHIDHICQVTGSATHVGIGSSFDGGFGCESTPSEIETIADLPKLADALAERGYSELDVDRIMSGNWLTVLGKAVAP